MKAVIIEKPYAKKLYGISGKFSEKGAWESGKPLMDRVWEDIRAYQHKSTGINYWYYYGVRSIFVGVELLDTDIENAKLEFLDIQIPRYAYLKFIGQYNGMNRAYNELSRLISDYGRIETGNNLEIYGHDNGPNSTPEVEILLGIE
jgi:hypothetical protein